MTRSLLTVTSSLLVAAGLGLLGFYGASLAQSAQGHRQGLDDFRAAREARLASRTRVPDEGVAGAPRIAATTMPVADDRGPEDIGRELLAGLGSPDTSEWSAKRLAEYEALLAAATADQMPEGILRIPSVGLELPVFPGAAEAHMTRGAGRLDDTPPLGSEGNTGIAAHRDGYFRALKDVRIGDALLVETLDGEHRYEIVDLSIVEPDDVSVLDPTEESTITLVTCYPFYFVGSAPQRFIVRAEKR